MDFGLGAKFFCFFFRRRVRKEVTTADFRSRQILKQTRTAQWRVKLDVEVKTRIVAAIGRRLMQRHHVGKRHLPKVVEPDENLFQQCPKVAEFIVRERGDAAMSCFWRHKNLIRITREVRNESDG